MDDPTYHITYKPIAHGTRRRLLAAYSNGVSGNLPPQDYWYTYDPMNRFAIAQGTFVGTRGDGFIDIGAANQLNGGTTTGTGPGTEIGYNRAGERKIATYVSGGKTVQENYTYAVDGLLTKTEM